MAPDDDDLPWDRQFYNMEWMPYEDVYFGFIAAYHVLPGMEEKLTPGAPWMGQGGHPVDLQPRQPHMDARRRPPGLHPHRAGGVWTRAWSL